MTEPTPAVAARELIVWLRMRADCAHSSEIRDDLLEQAATVEWSLDRYEALGGRLPRVERPSGRIAKRFPDPPAVPKKPVVPLAPATRPTPADEPAPRRRVCECGVECDDKGALLRHVHFAHARVATRQELSPR